MSEQPIHMTGVTGGTVGTANVAYNVHGGMGNTTVNTGDGSKTIVTFVSQRSEETKQNRADIIMKRTISYFQDWNKNMVITAALGQVLDKLNAGTTWLAIKGNPGEGKTTVGYMALEELHRCGRQVFEVRTPEEFTEVISAYPNPVLMLDDAFGNLEFDPVKWANWEPVLSPLLKEREHKLHGKEDQTSKKDVTIIIIGRGYVLNSLSVNLGRLFVFLSSDKHVVLMDHSLQRDIEEKRAIWESISRLSGVELEKITVDKILRTKVPHGFPHVCRLFTTINKETNAEEFFRKPLLFLNESIKTLMEDTNNVLLCKEIVKGEGKVSSRQLRQMCPKYTFINLAKSLIGSYLKFEEDSYVFDHDSIYDSVAFHICSLDPEFVIQNCHMSFINERLRLQLSQDAITTSSSPSDLVVFVHRSYADVLAQRCATELGNNNFVHVLSHQAFTDKTFVENVMSIIKPALTSLIHSSDQKYCSFNGNTFFSLVPSSKSPELLKYLHKCPDIELTVDDEEDISIIINRFSKASI